jgi:MFS family permease
MKVEIDTKTTQTAAKSPLTVIFFTVFIDLIGFGIIIPLSPYLARQFHASSFEIGLLLAAYSLTQFIFSPIWGGLSDRVGRRPVILISLLGGALSYTLFAFGQTFWILLLARALAGVFGGNISTAHAYIADVTTPENRSKGMGLLGAAFGLGFIVGPMIGAGLGILGQRMGETPPLGSSFSALGAAALCLANFVFAYFVLRESLPPEKRGLKIKRNRLVELKRQMSRPIAGPLMWVFFLSGLAMAQMETMLFPYMFDRFGWDLRLSSYGFAYIGVLMVFTQGYLVRKWMPKFGESHVLKVGLLMFALSLVALPFSFTISILAVTMTVLAIGNGLMRPPNLGLISLATPPDEQGLTMGVTNSLASLGRIIGPLIGGVAYSFSQAAPFLVAGGLAALAWGIVILETRKLKSHDALKTT